ncbi:MAG: 1,4-dihydroxy-2-naphthoate polyprenyltransferase [Solirubrobacterales bacterium]
MFRNFLKLVEISTKAASIIPFLMGTSFSLYRYKCFNLKLFILMFISLTSFDMCTTAINNYCDHNYIGFQVTKVEKIILTLLAVACASGIFLVLSTNFIVFAIGVISFLAGIFYTFGPIPISRMPLGEIFSGIFMGFVIIFLSIYIQIFDKGIISFFISSYTVYLTVNLKEVLIILLFSLPAANSIANIMLANNICDLEDDIQSNRYTLPYYIGIENSFKLFRILYYIAYIDLVVLILLRITPVINILILITFLPVNNHIEQFINNPIKSKTFVLSVINFILINLPQVMLVGLYSWF